MTRCALVILALISLVSITGCRWWGRDNAPPTVPAPSATLSPIDLDSPSNPSVTQITSESHGQTYPPPSLTISTPVAQSDSPIRSYPAPVVSEEQERQVVSNLSRLIPNTFLPILNNQLGNSSMTGGLLDNGDFGSLEPWFCIGGCQLEVKFGQEPRSLLVTQRDQRFDGIAQSVTASIAPNGWYQTRVSVRSPSGEHLFVWVVLEVITSTGTQYFGTPVTPVLNAAWQPLTGDHHTSWTGTLRSATWRVETEPADADILIADASLTEIAVFNPSVPVNRLTIFPDRPRQMVHSVVGGNFDHRSAGVDLSLDSVARFNIRNLNVRRARVMVELSQWQSALDGPIMDEDKMQQTFQMMSQFQEAGIDYMISVYDVPDWLLRNGTAPRRVIDPSQYGNLADFLIGWIRYAQSQYGASFSLIGFNEPDLGARLLWSPQGMAEFISIAGPRFDDAGLDIRFILGDCFAIANCRSFVQPIWNNRAIRKYTGLIATHSWDNPQPPDAVYRAFGDFAAATDLSLATTEVGWDSQMWQTGIPPMDSWEHALQTAIVYSKLLKLTGTSTTYFWQMLGTDYPTNNGLNGFPVSYILQQFGQGIPTGARVVETSDNEGGLYSVAAVTGGKLAVILINSTNDDIEIQVAGLFGGVYSHLMSYEGKQAVNMDNIQVRDEEATINITRSSVNLIQQR